MDKTRVVLTIVVCLACVAPAAAQPTFSLDDNPAAPITSPPGPLPGLGAEDPYGITGRVPLPGFAPSPTLGAIGAVDGDLLTPTGAGLPALHAPAPIDAATGLPIWYMDAMSNVTPNMPSGSPIRLVFSVDRVSRGIPGVGVVPVEASLNQQPGDLFISAASFVDPAPFVGMYPANVGYLGLMGAGPGVVSGNGMGLDESKLDLTVTATPGVQTPQGLPGVPMGYATHDNVDAVEFKPLDVNGDLLPDVNYYHSINPDMSGLLGFPGPGGDPGDIFVVPPAIGLSTLYAPAASIGLFNQLEDDIDALVVYDQFNPGVLDPGIDFALFSLSPGSGSLLNTGRSAADVFFSDFRGTFAVYAEHFELGLNPDDNVDALEITLPGDNDLDGDIDNNDIFMILGGALFGIPGPIPTSWQLGDYDFDGDVDNNDIFAILGTGMFGAGSYTAEAPLNEAVGVPEPAAGLLLLVGAGSLLRRRR